MVEFDIMRIEGMMVLFVVIIFEIVIFALSISVVAIGVVSCDWCMDRVMSIEMGMLLNAMNIMVSIMSWVECVGMRVVVERTMAVISNVMMSVMEIINVTFVMWSLVVVLVDWVLLMYIMMDNIMVWSLMVEFVVSLVVWSLMMDIVMLFMVYQMGWVVWIVVMFMGSHFRVDIVDSMWQFMIVMGVIMIMFNHSTFNRFMLVMSLMSVVILIMNMVELWLMIVLMFVVNIMVISMFSFMVVVMVIMVVIVVIHMMWLVMSSVSFSMLVVMSFVVIIKVSMVLNMAFITSEISVMFTIVNMPIMVVARFMAVDVSWAIFIMMSTCAMVVKISFPTSVGLVLLSVNWSVVVWCFVMRCIVVRCIVVNILVYWSEVVVSMPFKMIDDWTFMMRSIMVFCVFHQVLHCVCTMGPSFTMARIWVVAVIMESSISPVAFCVMFIMWMLFVNTVKVVSSTMSIVLGVEIWIITVISVVHWIHAMVEFSIIMMIIWVVTTFPMGVSVMITNIFVFITWKMFLSTGIMVVCWFTSHWCDVSWMMKIVVEVMVVIWLHL